MEARQSCGPGSTDDRKDQWPAGMDGWGWEMQLGRSAPGVTAALCNELRPLLLTYQACGLCGGAEDVGRAEQKLEQAHTSVPGMSRPQAQTLAILCHFLLAWTLSLAKM